MELTLSRALLFFYLIVASNFTKNLYSGQLQEYIEKSRVAQHIIGFILMLVVIISFGGVSDITKAIGYTIFAYVLFIFTTKLDIHWNLVILLLLVIGFLYESKIFNREKLLDNDESLGEREKSEIRFQNDTIKIVLLVALVFVTFIGTFLYSNKKITQYGGEFSTIKYIFAPRN